MSIIATVNRGRAGISVHQDENTETVLVSVPAKYVTVHPRKDGTLSAGLHLTPELVDELSRALHALAVGRMAA